MGRVIFYRNPLDSTKITKIEDHLGTIEDALIYLRIEKEALSVTINGECPDECDIKYLLKEDDLIEIRRLVHGSSSRSKSNAATIVQLIGLAAMFIPGLQPLSLIAIGLGTSVIAGALNARAAKLALKESSGAEVAEIDVASNSFSLANVSNDARPLQPMTLPMGSHRYAPDYHTDAFTSVFDSDFNLGPAQPISTSFIPGIDENVGPESAVNAWVEMPKDFIYPGLPRYNIKIAPWHFNLDPNTTPTTAQINHVRNSIKSIASILGAGFSYHILWSMDGRYGPLVIYHSDATDPFYGRYNLFHFLGRNFAIGNDATSYGYLSKVFTGTTSGSENQHYYQMLSPYTPAEKKDLLYMGSVGITHYYYPSTVDHSDTYTQLIPKYGTLLSTLNDGVFNNTNKTQSFAIENLIPTMSVTEVLKEGTDYSTQTFNFGIGDLKVTDRVVGSLEYDIEAPDTQNVGFAPIIVGPPSYEPAWTIKEVPIIINDILIREFPAYPDILRLEAKKLYNEDSPTTPIDVDDNDKYNFIYLEGQKGMTGFRFTLSGQLYGANATGLISNGCSIEIQWKRSTDTVWSYNGSLGIDISNENTKKINYNYGFSVEIDPDQSLQVRVRKMTLDSVNNVGDLTCDLYADKICFFREYSTDVPNGFDRFINAPMNLEAVAVTAYADDKGQTNKYSALIESKCWVYDFDSEEWAWDFNRNPAFWFLYFAYGGFKNIESDSGDPYGYPYSPTTGWVNYPNHPNSTEHIFGAGLTQDEIDMDKILEWGEFCEDRNLKLDMVLKDDTSCEDVLERIANVGRGSVSYYRGKLSVVYEDEQQTPVCMYGMGNIIAGSFNVEYAVGDPVGKVVAKYVDRTDWETKEVEAIVPFATDSIKVLELNLEGVTETQQAQREVNILAARQYFQRRSYTWRVDHEGLLATRGDLVYLSHDSTQYGYSGRIKGFILDSGNVIGIETTAILEDSAYVTVRTPNNEMATYQCHVEGKNIIFDEPYPIEKASFFIDHNTNNTDSDFTNSIPEDFIFICGSKQTPGKLVRISGIKALDDSFEITAVDEDPAMWSYEYGPAIDPESFDDAELVLKIQNVTSKPLGNGLVRITWEGSEFIKIINEFSSLPIESNGAYSFTGGEVILELDPNEKYNLRIEPFAIGTPYKAESKKVAVWT